MLSEKLKSGGCLVPGKAILPGVRDSFPPVLAPPDWQRKIWLSPFVFKL